MIIGGKHDLVLASSYSCESCKFLYYFVLDHKYICINNLSQNCSKAVSFDDVCDSWEMSEKE